MDYLCKLLITRGAPLGAPFFSFLYIQKLGSIVILYSDAFQFCVSRNKCSLLTTISLYLAQGWRTFEKAHAQIVYKF